MDYERYYDKRSNGNYIVHFPNNKGLNEDEINKMFSHFGNVLNVDNRGKSHGLSFVTFSNLKDVKCCIDGLKNHKYIKILRHINKHKTDAIEKKVKCTKEKKGFANDSMTTVSNGEERFEDQQLSKQSDSITTYKSNSSISSKSNSENLDAEKQILNETEIPALIPVEQKCTRIQGTCLPRTKFIPAEEVIVANIHPSLSTHYILHLIAKYNPIAISNMMTTVRTGISYCHVYYKTREEAELTTKEFDTCRLFGNSLIVLTSQQLMKEALQS